MAKSAPTDCEQAALDHDTLAMAGAEILLKSLEDEDVEVIFGYPGGAVLPIYDAFSKITKSVISSFATNKPVHAAELCSVNWQGWRCSGDI